jgi:hypothetical protein
MPRIVFDAKQSHWIATPFTFGNFSPWTLPDSATEDIQTAEKKDEKPVAADDDCDADNHTPAWYALTDSEKLHIERQYCRAKQFNDTARMAELVALYGHIRDTKFRFKRRAAKQQTDESLPK